LVVFAIVRDDGVDMTSEESDRICNASAVSTGGSFAPAVAAAM